MRTISKIVATSIFSLAIGSAGCGPSGDDKVGAVDASSGSADSREIELDPASLLGTVWVPGNAPGMVPLGQEMPVFDAVVYLTSARPAPIEAGATCRPCIEAPANAVQTDHQGSFSIGQIIPGEYWMVIEKGDFRLEQQVTFSEGQILTLEDAQTTLPSEHDPANGKTIPKVAMATGVFDDLEDILGKMGMGSVDASGAFDGPSAVGIFDFYDNGGSNKDQALGTLEDLMRDLNTMLTYDIIFIPCSGSTYSDVLKDTAVLHNVRDYVAAGGKLYVTDWSGEWADNVFPEQIELGSNVDTPASAYDRVTDAWDFSKFGSANGSPRYESDHAEAVDEDLMLWLDGQVGPNISGSIEIFAATDMVIEGNWNHIEGLHAVQIGLDDMGNPIVDTPVKYVIGEDTTGGIKKPLTVTYEPAGCGRVLYSTYHTTERAHVGLVPQERVLVYLIMEIGVCNDNVVID